MPGFASCVIERLDTVYFTQSVPELGERKKKNLVMPHVNAEKTRTPVDLIA